MAVPSAIVTGTLLDLFGNPISGLNVVFSLEPIVPAYSGPWIISGTTILTQPPAAVSAVTNASGTFTITLWGNDAITSPQSFYAVQAGNFSGEYQFLQANNYNLLTAVPIVPFPGNPLVVPPIGAQAANLFYAGPASGSPQAPAFRLIGLGDLPTSGSWSFAGTISGNTTFSGNKTFSGTNTHSGTETFTNGITTNSLTDSGLTSGNCVQATTGGLLTTVSGPCGTSTGTITATGSPVSGNLTKFSGATSITSADLTGDVTTSGGVATTLAGTVGGAHAFTGTATFTNIVCKTFSGVACVDNANSAAWSGADACAWINSAQASLPSRGGVVDARGLSGVINCAASVTVGSSTQAVAVWLGPVDLGVQSTFTLAQGSKVIGVSGGSGSSGTTPTIIRAGGSFPTSTVLVQWSTSGTSDGIKLEDVQVNCNDVAGSVGIDTNNSEDISTINRVFIYKCVANDIQISGASQAVGIYDTSTLGSSVSAGTHNGLTIGSNADHVTLINFGASKLGAQSTGAGILCTACNIYVHGMHVENHVDGILLAGAGTGAPTFVGINGLNNITNTIHVSSTWTGSLVALGIRKFLGTNSLKNDIASFNHVCTDESLASYVLASSTTASTQLQTTCGTLASKFVPGFFIGDTNGFATGSAVLNQSFDPASLDSVRVSNHGSATRTWVYGPGTGGAGFGLRQVTPNAQTAFICQDASPFNCTFSVPITLQGVAVASLPAAASNIGAIMRVTDSTTIAAEGQTCVGGSSVAALAFSNGTVWKCF